MRYYITKTWKGQTRRIGKLLETKKRAEAYKRFLQFFDPDSPKGAKYEIKKEKRKRPLVIG